MGKGKLDKLPKGKLIAYFKIGIYICLYMYVYVLELFEYIM